MPKKKKASSSKFHLPKQAKVPVLCLAAVVVAVILAFAFRGWVRTTVVPKTASLFYLHDVASTLDDQDNKLSNPLSALRFSTVTEKKSCNLELAQSFHEEIDCNATKQSYTKLPTGKNNLNKEEQEAAGIQSRLKGLGWQPGSNGVTLTSLVDGIAHGVDYSPDANYEKIIGNNNDCVLDLMIAYSNPQPPALRTTFSCDRTLDFLGTPQGQFYSSSKGNI